MIMTLSKGKSLSAQQKMRNTMKQRARSHRLKASWEKRK